MSTAHDRWLAAPYVETDPAAEALDSAMGEVTEDQISAALEETAMSEAHEWLANSADLIGRLLKMPTIRIGMSPIDLAALDVLSRVADCAFTERQMAIQACAEAAIAGDRQDAADAEADARADR